MTRSNRKGQEMSMTRFVMKLAGRLVRDVLAFVGAVMVAGATAGLVWAVWAAARPAAATPPVAAPARWQTCQTAVPLNLSGRGMALPVAVPAPAPAPVPVPRVVERPLHDAERAALMAAIVNLASRREWADQEAVNRAASEIRALLQGYAERGTEGFVAEALSLSSQLAGMMSNDQKKSQRVREVWERHFFSQETLRSELERILGEAQDAFAAHQRQFMDQVRGTLRQQLPAGAAVASLLEEDAADINALLEQAVDGYTYAPVTSGLGWGMASGTVAAVLAGYFTSTAVLPSLAGITMALCSIGGGCATGAGMGSMMGVVGGPIGMAIGGAVGSIIGYGVYRYKKSEAEQQLRQAIAQRFKEFGEQLIDQGAGGREGARTLLARVAREAREADLETVQAAIDGIRVKETVYVLPDGTVVGGPAAAPAAGVR